MSLFKRKYRSQGLERYVKASPDKSALKQILKQASAEDNYVSIKPISMDSISGSFSYSLSGTLKDKLDVKEEVNLGEIWKGNEFYVKMMATGKYAIQLPVSDKIRRHIVKALKLPPCEVKTDILSPETRYTVFEFIGNERKGIPDTVGIVTLKAGTDKAYAVDDIYLIATKEERIGEVAIKTKEEVEVKEHALPKTFTKLIGDNAIINRSNLSFYIDKYIESKEEKD